MKTGHVIGSSLMCALLFVLSACTRQGSAKQKAAFEEAVAIESRTQSVQSRQAAYMRVVAIDPKSEYGKAAAARVEQLSREMQSFYEGRGAGL